MKEALICLGIYAAFSILVALGFARLLQALDDAASDGKPNGAGCEAEGVAVHDERNAA